MEITAPNLHKKIIDMCDCYLETDYLAKMRAMTGSRADDLEEDAIKYLALAILYSVTESAGKLSFKRKGETVTITAKTENGKLSLPLPDRTIVEEIFRVMHDVMHLPEESGKMAISLGIGNNQLNGTVKLKVKDDKESLTLVFN